MTPAPLPLPDIVGNAGARARKVLVQRPLHAHMDAWCQQGPSHHIALGMGDLSLELQAFAEAAGFQIVRS